MPFIKTRCPISFRPFTALFDPIAGLRRWSMIHSALSTSASKAASHFSKPTSWQETDVVDCTSGIAKICMRPPYPSFSSPHPFARSSSLCAPCFLESSCVPSLDDASRGCFTGLQGLRCKRLLLLHGKKSLENCKDLVDISAPKKIFSPPPPQKIPQFVADPSGPSAPPVRETTPPPGIFNKNRSPPLPRLTLGLPLPTPRAENKKVSKTSTKKGQVKTK